MEYYVGEYRDDTVEYIKDHLKKLDRFIDRYEDNDNDRCIALLQAKSTALIALSNIGNFKELD